MPNKLKDYQEKRDFQTSPEPDQKDNGLDWAKQRPIFVIQKHEASTLHYDFRIEVDGVLKSWAIPKGPSTDPSVKRLAIPTEDHPLSYADFEGVIPKQSYGGGTVLVWDRGNYRNLKGEGGGNKTDIASQLDQGHLTIWLEGQKISGGYALIRPGKEAEKRWLFIKMDDEKADARRRPISTEADSVKTGKSMKEISEEGMPDEE